MHRRYLVWKYYSGTRRKILRNSVTVQDFSFALFEFFPSRKLAVTEHDHMRLTLRAMFIACALGSVKKYTSLSDDLYHFFGIVLCYQQPKYAFKK